MKKITLITCLLLISSQLFAATPAVKADSNTINTEEFAKWVSANPNLSAGDREMVLASIAKNNNESSKHFKKACDAGDDRGCMQFGIYELTQNKFSGATQLLRLSEKSKNQKLALFSAQFLGAFTLDYKSTYTKYVDTSIEALMPFANKNEPISQFILANLFYVRMFYDDADKMLTKACINKYATVNIKQFCNQSAGIEKLINNKVIDAEVNQEGRQATCGK